MFSGGSTGVEMVGVQAVDDGEWIQFSGPKQPGAARERSVTVVDTKPRPGSIPNQSPRRLLSTILGARTSRTPHDNRARVLSESAAM